MMARILMKPEMDYVPGRVVNVDVYPNSESASSAEIRFGEAIRLGPGHCSQIIMVEVLECTSPELLSGSHFVGKFLDAGYSKGNSFDGCGDLRKDAWNRRGYRVRATVGSARHENPQILRWQSLGTEH